MNELIRRATFENDELEHGWPRDGDRLFIEESWASDARIVRDPKERFYRMPIGYMRAGDILIERAMNDVVDRKNIVYAALFLLPTVRRPLPQTLPLDVAVFAWLYGSVELGVID